MSVLVELNVEYNRFFSKAVIALAREDYVAGRMYLEKAAKALNEIAVRRTGENKDYTQDWVFDIVKEIGDLDRRINNERSKEKMMKIESCVDCGKCKSKCPYGLDTPNLLRLNLEDYKKIANGEIKV